MDTNVRDLADPTLWERSLERARHRRRIAELSRRSARRRKATSVAVAGAVATSPATPLLPAAGAEGESPRSSAPLPPSSGAAAAVLLERGSVGEAVAQVQRRLGVDDDGIFGPITERAVRRFQAAHGLAVTGVVDATTWAAIFRSQVLFLRGAPKADAADLARVAPAIVVRSGAPNAAADSGAVAPDGADSAASAPHTADLPAPPASRRGATDRSASSRGGDPERVASDLRSDAAPPPRPAPPVPALSGECSTVTPVKGVRTGDFGEDRGSHRHAGVDIAAATGTAVRAAACGRIVEAGVQSGYGNLVCIQHAGGTTTCYAHLSRIDVRMRQWVESGQVIGAVGCTGSCTGPHLHFEVRENGRPVDPSGYVNGTRSLPRGRGGTGGGQPTATPARTASRATTSTWSSGAQDSAGGWSQAAHAEPAAAPATEQPAPAEEQPTATPAAEQPAAGPAAAPAPAPDQPAAATPAEQPAPTPAPAPAPAPTTPAAPAEPTAPAVEATPDTEVSTPPPAPAEQQAPAVPPPALPPAAAPAPPPAPATDGSAPSPAPAAEQPAAPAPVAEQPAAPAPEAPPAEPPATTTS